MQARNARQPCRNAAHGNRRPESAIPTEAASSGLPLLPFIVEETQHTGDGLVRDWPAPDFGIDQHRSYMVQWYSLAALGVVLWLVLNWRTGKDDGAASR